MSAEPCPVCDGQPRVLVAMQHPAMLRLTRELLERQFGCWVATEVRTGSSLARSVARHAPDLLVIDAAAFPRSCLGALAQIPAGRMIVIGPEPDPAYEAAALASGAGAWLARDDLAEGLSQAMRRILGCTHDPCPSGQRRRTAHVPARSHR